MGLFRVFVLLGGGGGCRIFVKGFLPVMFVVSLAIRGIRNCRPANRPSPSVLQYVPKFVTWGN